MVLEVLMRFHLWKLLQFAHTLCKVGSRQTGDCKGVLQKGLSCKEPGCHRLSFVHAHNWTLKLFSPFLVVYRIQDTLLCY